MHVEALKQGFATDAMQSLLAWWDEAGVGCAVNEVPTRWLERATPAPARPASAVPATPAFPETLDAFVAWLGTADLADAGPAGRRVAPTGPAHADLMILSDFPDRDDVDARMLFSGPLAPLFDKMLGALGVTRDSVYIAALSPGRPITGRLSADSIDVLTPVARHHIQLVAPRRLWLVGAAPSCALLGIDDARARGSLHTVNLNGANIATIATAHPRFFEGSKARKQAAWTEMQRLLDKDTA